LAYHQDSAPSFHCRARPSNEDLALIADLLSLIGQPQVND